MSRTDHVPLEAMNIELSRQESVSRLQSWNLALKNHAAQLAKIKKMSRQELRSTGGNCQGDDRQESCS